MADLDQSLFNFLFQFTHKSFILDAAYVILGQYFPYLLVLILLFLIFSRPTWRLRLFFLCEAALAIILSRGLLTEIIRFFFPRERPFAALNLEPLIVDNASSFPSGHAAFFFSLSAVLFFWNKRWGAYYLISALILSAARVFAGVHWPLDIAGGAMAGALSGLAVHYLVAPYLREVKKTTPALGYHA